MDLSITDEMALMRLNDNIAIIDPYDASSFEGLWEIEALPALIPPGCPALLCTKEVVDIPLDQVGDILLRSTFARLGLVAPPTTADPGFRGQLTLEVFNAGRYYFQVRPGDMLFHMVRKPQVGEPPYEIDGRYQGQQGITLPKALRRTNGGGQ